jgi:hemolysin III
VVEVAFSEEVKDKAPVSVAAETSEERVKPLLRGIPDVAATLVALPAVFMLVQHARAGIATIAATVYGICLLLLFSVSATYHTFMWPLHVRMMLRRFDHSMVYVLIAGCYTPVCLITLDPGLSTPLMVVVWGMTALGIGKSFLWSDAPRWLNTGVYLFMGWIIVPFSPAVYRGLGYDGFILLAAGGLAYTLGAIIYARRWPNPSPRIFGYHEVFHVFVVGAGVCHYVTFWHLLT